MVNWQIDYNNPIAKGSYGTVYKMIFRSRNGRNDKIYAFKKIDKGIFKTDNAEY